MTKKASVSEVRELIREAPYLKSMDREVLVGVRAGMDQMLAEWRDDGVADEQAGTMMMYVWCAHLRATTPELRMLEIIEPGILETIVCAILLEVFDDAPS